MKIREKYKKIVIIAVPVLVLMIIGYLIGNMITMQDKISQMGNQLSYLIDTNSILQSQVTNLQSNIEAALEEEASLVENQSIEVIDSDFAKGTYWVKISVVPKEYSEATKVSIFFGTNEIPLTLNRYAYEGTAELSLKNNYDGNVTFLFVNGDKKNTEILKDYRSLQTKLEDLLYGSIPEIPECKDGKIRFDDEIAYTLNAYENYGYETLELILMADEENITTVNLLEYPEEDEKEKDVFSGLFGASIETAEPNTQDTEQTTISNTEMVYGISGTTAFKESYDVEDGQFIRLFLRAKCENGYTLEYDLFSGVVEAEGPNGFGLTEDYFVPNYRIYDKLGNKFEIE